MDLGSLAIFRTVVREAGVTKAAAKLNRVQSNVTTRIRQLEATLGTELFERNGRKLVLTPAGETLLPYAERLLALADEARHAVRENRPQGRLRLGTMESTAASRLPRVLAAYHQRWPDVTLELATGVTRALIDSVRAYEVDAAVLARPIEPNALPAELFETVPVFEEELVLVTPRGQHPTAMAQQIAGLTLVAFERGCAYRAYAMRCTKSKASGRRACWNSVRITRSSRACPRARAWPSRRARCWNSRDWPTKWNCIRSAISAA